MSSASAPADSSCQMRPPRRLLSSGDVGLFLQGVLGDPFLILDSHERVVAMSVAAERFLGAKVEDLGELRFSLAFGVRPLDRHQFSSRDSSEAGLGTSGGDCVLTTRAGEVKVVRLRRSTAPFAGEVLSAVFIEEGDQQLPSWALLDTVSGLPNRAAFERRRPIWSVVAGVVAIGDCDGLKEINDERGHAAGDLLLAGVGRALRDLLEGDLAGTGAFACRYGGDEFVIVVESFPGADLNAARERLFGALRGTGPDSPLSMVTWGTAPFEVGRFAEGMSSADTDLYARKGVLLQASSGGRVLVSAKRSAELTGPAHSPAERRPTATYGTAIGSAFDSYSRLLRPGAAEDGASFVEWVNFEPGIAAVEIGAGAGRITFDGGLAQRIGNDGALLVTDPSRVQLDHARGRAAQEGLDWVRFVEAPAEELPVGAGAVDLVIGADFLHFCIPPKPVLREAARVLRPGGIVALSAWLEFQWPRCWLEILSPLHAALLASGRSPRPLMDLRKGDLSRMCESAGLVPIRTRTAGPSVIEFPASDVTVAYLRQAGHLALLASELDPTTRDSVVMACERRIVEVLSSCTAADRDIHVMREEVVARKP